MLGSLFGSEYVFLLRQKCRIGRVYWGETENGLTMVMIFKTVYLQKERCKINFYIRK